MSGLVGKVFTGVDSERTSTMWISSGDTKDLSVNEDEFEVEDLEAHDEVIVRTVVTGQKFTQSDVRSQGYTLDTFDMDVQPTMGIQVNAAPYVSGSTKLSMVRTKIDNQISVVLPLIKDDDSLDDGTDAFHIEARMRDNRKIQFWPRPSPTYANQFELWSNVLTVDNITLGYHDVDVKFIDKVTKIVGIELSFKVEVLSLADYLNAGLDA